MYDGAYLIWIFTVFNIKLDKFCLYLIIYVLSTVYVLESWLTSLSIFHVSGFQTTYSIFEQQFVTITNSNIIMYNILICNKLCRENDLKSVEKRVRYLYCFGLNLDKE